jgi:predicted AAA+ superfamily ATPase
MELSLTENLLETYGQLEHRLIYGSYPALWHQETLKDKQTYLRKLCSEYLFQDILRFENLQHSDKLADLLRLLAFQIGHEVSLDELSQKLSINRQTVERYLDLLSKSFVIYKVRGFSRNLRKEVSKSSRWYFYDNGVRNTLIDQFALPAFRNDMGQLWENYLMAERMKFQSYTQWYGSRYFWRTYDQQEIDLIEEKDGQLAAFEFKYGKTKAKIPAAWKKTYPEASFRILHPRDYLDFVGIT